MVGQWKSYLLALNIGLGSVRFRLRTTLRLRKLFILQIQYYLTCLAGDIGGRRSTYDYGDHVLVSAHASAIVNLVPLGLNFIADHLVGVAEAILGNRNGDILINVVNYAMENKQTVTICIDEEASDIVGYIIGFTDDRVKVLHQSMEK